MRRPQHSPQTKTEALKRAEKLAQGVKLLQNLQQFVPVQFGKHFESLGHRDMVRKRLQKGGDVKVSLIMALSTLMDMNFLDMYIQQLPPSCRKTAQVREAEWQIEELKKQLEAKQQESDTWQERCLRAEKLIEDRMKG